MEEFEHEVSVAKILNHSGLMGLLYSKVEYTRCFINHIRLEGTDSEKSDIDWLDAAIKVRAAMTIKPFHKSVVADLSSIFRLRHTADCKLDREFANLESQSDFEKTYKAYDDGKFI